MYKITVYKNQLTRLQYYMCLGERLLQQHVWRSRYKKLKYKHSKILGWNQNLKCKEACKQSDMGILQRVHHEAGCDKHMTIVGET